MSKASESGKEWAAPANLAVGGRDDVFSSTDLGEGGLTKREHFAAIAMQGYLSMLAWSDGEGGSAVPSHKEVAREAVSYADALLEELASE